MFCVRCGKSIRSGAVYQIRNVSDVDFCLHAYDCVGDFSGIGNHGDLFSAGVVICKCGSPIVHSLQKEGEVKSPYCEICGKKHDLADAEKCRMKGEVVVYIPKENV